MALTDAETRATKWGGFALLAGVIAWGACTPPPARKPLDMVPIGTVPVADRTPREDDSDGGTTTPNSGPTVASKEGACTGSEFGDLEEVLRGCETAMPKSADLPSKVKEKLEVKVSAATSSTTPGGRVDVLVVLKNKSTDPLPLYFAGSPDVKFELEAFDAKGKRVDVPPGKAPAYPKGYSPPSGNSKALRITLTAGGSARFKVPFDAMKWKWAPERLKSWDGKGYPKSAAGPLPAGKYNVRPVLPLMGVGELDLPRLAIDVGG